MTVDKGFDVERVLAVDMALPAKRYGETAGRSGFYKRALERVATLPGLRQTAVASALPLAGEAWIDLVSAENDGPPLIERPPRMSGY